MQKNDEHYKKLLEHAILEAGSCREVALLLGAKSQAAVQMWKKNGVSYKFRPILDSVFEENYRKSIDL